VAFLDHPQLVERDRWRTIDSPAGPIRALLPPVQMDGVDPVMGAVPELGQHSEPILLELGFDQATINGWKEEQVI
jgi:crotonobetainyl-CoA:carnitine CoA-transferase CaiB-like acyl-CoA transferase